MGASWSDRAAGAACLPLPGRINREPQRIPNYCIRAGSVPNRDAIAGLTRYQVRLTVPRVGGWRAWGAVSEEFEPRLAEQESPAIAVHVDSWARRGRDYLQVVIVATVGAADVADALDLAWQAFRKAARDDAGWDLAAATAEVRPGIE